MSKKGKHLGEGVTKVLKGGKWEQKDGAQWAFFNEGQEKKEPETSSGKPLLRTKKLNLKEEHLKAEKPHLSSEKVSITELGKRQSGRLEMPSSMPVATDILKVDTILSDRYKILKFLKAMEQRRLYLAQDTRLDKYCFIKELAENYKSEEEREYFEKRFKEEAKLLSSLEHPNLPKVKDFFLEGNRSFMIVEYIKGSDMETICQYKKEFTEEEVLLLGINMCDALSCLHKHSPPIIHRDIKPSSLFIKEDEWTALIFNLNLSKIYDRKSTKNVGSSIYASPEQVSGYPEPASDIYSLGATLYHFLAGTPPVPFHFKTLREVNSFISEETDLIIRKALSEDVKDRFIDVDEMRDALSKAREKLSPKQDEEEIELVDEKKMKYRKKDKVYLDLIDELLETDYISIISIFLSEKDKLDKRFFEIFEHKLKVELIGDDILIERLNIANNIINKFGFRKNPSPSYVPVSKEEDKKGKTLEDFYNESDKIYLDIINELISAEPDAITGIILANRSKLDRRFIEIFDYKLNVDARNNQKLGDDLSYINSVFDNLKIRKFADESGKSSEKKIVQKDEKEKLQSTIDNENDRPYIDLINELISAGPDAITGIILSNKKKLDRKFFEIFDYKLKYEALNNPELAEDLSYVNNVIENLRIRKSLESSLPEVKKSSGKKKKEVLSAFYHEDDKVYLDLMEQLLSVDFQSVTGVILTNRKKFDRRFFEIFDHKLNVEARDDVKISEDLSYINRIVENLRLRQSIDKVEKFAGIKQKISSPEVYLKEEKKSPVQFSDFTKDYKKEVQYIILAHRLLSADIDTLALLINKYNNLFDMKFFEYIDMLFNLALKLNKKEIILQLIFINKLFSYIGISSLSVPLNPFECKDMIFEQAGGISYQAEPVVKEEFNIYVGTFTEFEVWHKIRNIYEDDFLIENEKELSSGFFKEPDYDYFLETEPLNPYICKFYLNKTTPISKKENISFGDIGLIKDEIEKQPSFIEKAKESKTKEVHKSFDTGVLIPVSREGFRYEEILNNYLLKAIDNQADNLSIMSGSSPIINLFGDMYRLDFPPVTSDFVDNLLRNLFNENLDTLSLNNKILRKIYHFSAGSKMCRFKVVLQELLGEFVIKFFYIPELPLMEKLNLPPVLPELIDYSSGLVIISSPSRNGKSTTLHSLVEIININKSCYVMMIEAVIEYIHKSKNSFILQRESGNNIKYLKKLFHIALKNQTDIIVVDEIDSFESISFALSAAECGKLVIATMAGSNAASVLSNIIERTPLEERRRIKDMMANLLRVIFSQNLLVSGKKNFMIPATEILFSCKKLSHIIKEERLYEIPVLIDTSSHIGMQPLDRSLMSLYKENLISRQTVLDMIQDIRMFE